MKRVMVRLMRNLHEMGFRCLQQNATRVVLPSFDAEFDQIISLNRAPRNSAEGNGISKIGLSGSLRSQMYMQLLVPCAHAIMYLYVGWVAIAVNAPQNSGIEGFQ